MTKPDQSIASHCICVSILFLLLCWNFGLDANSADGVDDDGAGDGTVASAGDVEERSSNTRYLCEKL